MAANVYFYCFNMKTPKEMCLGSFWDTCLFGIRLGRAFGTGMGFQFMGVGLGTHLGQLWDTHILGHGLGHVWDVLPPRALGPANFGNIFGNPWDAFGKGLGC
jgi:hypothetical protein